MRILKKYEFIVEARKIYIKIKEESLDYLAYLTDVGYTVSCKDDLRWIIVYISKDRKTSAFYDGIKFSDISDDIISYIEYMSDKYYIEFVEFFGCKDTDSDPKDMGRSRIYKVEDLEKCNNLYFTSIKIAFKKNWKK